MKESLLNSQRFSVLVFLNVSWLLDPPSSVIAVPEYAPFCPLPGEHTSQNSSLEPFPSHTNRVVGCEGPFSLLFLDPPGNLATLD